jgi:hypothetical protein
MLEVLALLFLHQTIDTELGGRNDRGVANKRALNIGFLSVGVRDMVLRLLVSC